MTKQITAIYMVTFDLGESKYIDQVVVEMRKINHQAVKVGRFAVYLVSGFIEPQNWASATKTLV